MGEVLKSGSEMSLYDLAALGFWPLLKSFAFKGRNIFSRLVS